MAGFKMPQVEKKADFVRDNFNIIAEKYDLFNDMNTFFLHRYWKNTVVRKIKTHFQNRPFTCLDLCCGTGDISLRFHQNSPAEKVYSVDFSENMLSIARERLKHFPSAVVQIGDATELKDFQDESLDAISIGFGLRNVNHLDKALSEIFRVLKPGGIFINLDVGKVKNRFIRVFADFYFFKIVPLMGYLIWGGKNEMFDYLPVSSLHYPAQAELKQRMETTGFIDVAFTDYVFGNVSLHSGVKPG
ncbi:MAG: ubiquinone/menaquinone biosynthesis methyltransferase [Leptospiraceae bacterium]|nr:ubiquinone/menaquinone biosynthesis methyltransferase [Leptospiraceae bacterium]